MKKIIILCLGFLFFLTAGSFAVYYNIGFEEIPMVMTAPDISNNTYSGIINTANLILNFNLSDNIGFKFRLKDLYMNIPVIQLTNTNYLYVDRLSFEYNTDTFGLLAGRDLFLENNGLLIGNMADGARLGLNLFGIKERLYVYDSGLPGTLPGDINQFNIKPYDYPLTNNGANRLCTGIALEEIGFLTKSISGLVLYSVDMSTNRAFNPLYLSASAEGSIIPGLSYTITGVYQLGNAISNVNMSGWGADFDLLYRIEEPVNIGILGGVGIASGDNTNTGNIDESFRPLGKYDTGIVSEPDFSNLFIIKFGPVLKLLDDNLTIKVEYYYTMRLSVTNDTNNNVYSSSGTGLGNEIDGSVSYSFDPNISIFIFSGYFIRGNAYISTTNDYKVFAGVSVKL